MTIASLLTPDLILPALAAQSKAEVLDVLAELAERAHPHLERGQLAAALRERERQSTTALGDGIAVPHVRLPGLPAPLAALARTTAAIDCGAEDGYPTRLFLLLVAPTELPGGSLRLLAGAARLLSDVRCRTRLLDAPTAAALIAVLRDHEARAHAGLHAA